MQKANINFILSLYQSLRRGLSDWIDYLHNYGIIVIHSFIWFARANEDESINHPAPSPPPRPPFNARPLCHALPPLSFYSIACTVRNVGNSENILRVAAAW